MGLFPAAMYSITAVYFVAAKYSMAAVLDHLFCLWRDFPCVMVRNATKVTLTRSSKVEMAAAKDPAHCAAAGRSAPGPCSAWR